MKKQIPTKKHISLYNIDKDLQKKVRISLKKENSNANFNFLFILLFSLLLLVIFRVLCAKNYI